MSGRGAARSLLLACVAWAGAGALPARAQEPAAAPADYAAAARFVAGLEPGGGALARLAGRRTWIDYARDVDPRWQQLEARQLAPMRAWSAREPGLRADPAGEVLYPFSGPDLVNATAILPGRRGYLLLSLEPVGVLPDFDAFDETSFDAFFAGMRESLSSLLAWDFFQTRQLRRDLTAPGLDGVLPLLLFFAARSGQQVLAVEHLCVARDGALARAPVVPGSAARCQGVPGVRLSLRASGDGAAFDVDYFHVDLGIHSLETRPGFFAYAARRGPFTTYLKAASYLMFEPKYAGILRFVLDHSRRVLQDDSGVPLAEFVRRGWDVRLYGSYERPIRLFEHRYQQDLAEAYRTRVDVAPLPFAAGYRWRRGESTLMLATRPGG